MEHVKILVTEKISEVGLEVLRQDPEVDLQIRTGLSAKNSWLK
jgi:hypothetical protein